MGKKPKGISVNFKNASPTKKRRNLGVEMGRDEIDLETAAQLFINSQLECVISVDPNQDDDGEGQATFDPESDMVDLKFVAGVLNFTVNADVYAFTLQLPLSLHADDVERFRYRKGRLVCKRTGAAASPEAQPELALAQG